MENGRFPAVISSSACSQGTGGFKLLLLFTVFSSSYWLYSISLPDKYGMPQLDLSDDNEATMSTENSLLAPKERAINMVVTVSSKKKCEKLKNYLKDLDEKLKEVTNKCEQLEASNKKLLLKYKEGDAHNKRKRKKSWSEYSVQYKNKKLKCLDGCKYQRKIKMCR